MTTARDERIGSISVVLGATLLAVYAALFSLLLLPAGGAFDYVAAVRSPHWRAIALVAFVGVIALLVGLDGIYSRMRTTAGWTGLAGLVLTKVALILQAAVITWELLLDPIIAAHPESAFLLRDRVILTDRPMAVFRMVLLAATVLGALSFGVAVYRSNEFPKAAVLLLVAGAAVYAVGPMISILVAIAGVILFAIGGILIGARLWRVQNV
jgi:hypothetical protein